MGCRCSFPLPLLKKKDYVDAQANTLIFFRVLSSNKTTH